MEFLGKARIPARECGHPFADRTKTHSLSQRWLMTRQKSVRLDLWFEAGAPQGAVKVPSPPLRSGYRTGCRLDSVARASARALPLLSNLWDFDGTLTMRVTTQPSGVESEYTQAANVNRSSISKPAENFRLL